MNLFHILEIWKVYNHYFLLCVCFKMDKVGHVNQFKMAKVSKLKKDLQPVTVYLLGKCSRKKTGDAQQNKI